MNDLYVPVSALALFFLKTKQSKMIEKRKKETVEEAAERMQLEIMDEFSQWIVNNEWKLNYTTGKWENLDHLYLHSMSELYQMFLENKKVTMIYKCKNCSSESNDMDLGEYCEDCGDFTREKIIPTKREYTHDLIWQKYMENKCPVCDGKVDSDSQYSHTENGGKWMAKYFACDSCYSRYTVGYNRSRHPIMCEITYNAVHK